MAVSRDSISPSSGLFRMFRIDRILHSVAACVQLFSLNVMLSRSAYTGACRCFPPFRAEEQSGAGMGHHLSAHRLMGCCTVPLSGLLGMSVYELLFAHLVFHSVG